MARVEPAIRVRLSPSQDAVVSGGGNVMLFIGVGSGRSSWYVSDREMRVLVEEWEKYVTGRREGRRERPPRPNPPSP